MIRHLDRYLSTLLSLALGWTCASPAVSSESGARRDIVFFPGPLQTLVSRGAAGEGEPMQKAYAGWNMPGGGYRAGAGWWALVCDAAAALPDEKRGCRLAATSLSIARGTHEVYDDKPAASQLLRWSPLPGKLDAAEGDDNGPLRLIMVFKPVRSLAGLKLAAGPVATYAHRGMRAYPRPPGPGTLEVRLHIAPGRHADIVPRVFKPPPGAAAAPGISPTGGTAYDLDVLEIRAGERRQRLSARWPGCSSGAVRKPMDYLWWAGDLDGDGKPDLVLSGDHVNAVTLYLSSVAQGDDLVGEAGSFNFEDPGMGEC